MYLLYQNGLPQVVIWMRYYCYCSIAKVTPVIEVNVSMAHSLNFVIKINIASKLLMFSMRKHGLYFFFLVVADCPRVAFNHLDEGREKSSQTPVHAVISPRFLKSQPAPGLTTSARDLDQRLVQSQPVPFSALPRFVLL